MVKRYNSLSFRMVGLLLVHNSVATALLFHVADDTAPLNMLMIACLLAALTLMIVLFISRTMSALRTVADEVSKVASGRPAETRDHTGKLDALAAKMGGISREIGGIDRRAARFTPVTVPMSGSVGIPESRKRPKPGSHLRLVKS